MLAIQIQQFVAQINRMAVLLHWCQMSVLSDANVQVGLYQSRDMDVMSQVTYVLDDMS